MSLPLTTALTMAHSCPTKYLKENPSPAAFNQATHPLTHKAPEDKKAGKTPTYSKSYTMSSLATTAAANANPPGNQYDNESQEVASLSDSPASNGSNHMDTEENEPLGKHLDKFIQEQEEEEEPHDGEISFGPGHSFFCPPSFSQALVAQDLRTPDLPNIFWASIRLPIPASPSNATDAMFDALDEFLTKMQEADWKFSIFPHNLSQYGSLTALPPILDDPELLPLEVNDWLVYFLQAKPRFQGGDVYTTALVGTSLPLGKIMKAQLDWFKETCYGIWEASIQTEVPVLIGWLLFSTNNINTELLKQEISKFIGDILVGLQWKMITLGTQGKIPKENQVQALHVYVDKLDVTAAKPRLLEIYAGNASTKHNFPLHIRMHLIPKIDSILNTQGHRKIDKLHTCQAT